MKTKDKLFDKNSKVLQIRTIAEPGTTISNKTGSWRVYKPEFDQESCSMCGLCALYCPDGIVSESETGYYPDYEYCKGCGICADVCPKNAIKMEPVQELNKPHPQVEELENGLLKDKVKLAIVQLESPFYKHIYADENKHMFYWKGDSLNMLRTKIFSILNQIVETSQNRKINIIVFPEYTVPDSLKEHLMKFADDNGVIIVAGSSPINDLQSKLDRKNVCTVLVPDKKEYFFIEKKELSGIEAGYIEPGAGEGLNLLWKYNDNTYSVHIVLSLDYINLDETRKDIIIVPMCSENIDFFVKKVKKDIEKNVSKFVILCNTFTLTPQLKTPLIKGRTGIYGKLGKSPENEEMNIEQDMYLFSWDEIPGNDSGRFKKFLEKNFGVTWVRKSTIDKVNDGKTINVSPYLFSWDDIPGNDSGRFIEFLEKNFGVTWVRKSTIDKVNDGKTINVSSENNSLSLRLNDEETKAILTINSDRTDEFIVKIETGKLNMYASSPLSLRLNNEETKAILTINNGRTDEFIVKTENGKLNIYDKNYLLSMGWGEGVLFAELDINNLFVSNLNKFKLKYQKGAHMKLKDEISEIKGIVNPLLLEKLGRKPCFAFIKTEDYWKAKKLLEKSNYTSYAISGSFDLIIQHFEDLDLRKMLKEKSSILGETQYFNVNKVLRWYGQNNIEFPMGEPTEIEFKDLRKLEHDWMAPIPVDKRKEYKDKKYILGHWKDIDVKIGNKIHAFIVIYLPKNQNLKGYKAIFEDLLKSVIIKSPHIFNAFEGEGKKGLLIDYLIEVFDDPDWVFALVNEIHEKCSSQDIKCRTITSIVKENLSIWSPNI